MNTLPHTHAQLLATILQGKEYIRWVSEVLWGIGSDLGIWNIHKTSDHDLQQKYWGTSWNKGEWLVVGVVDKWYSVKDAVEVYEGDGKSKWVLLRYL